MTPQYCRRLAQVKDWVLFHPVGTARGSGVWDLGTRNEVFGPIDHWVQRTSLAGYCLRLATANMDHKSPYRVHMVTINNPSISQIASFDLAGTRP